MKGEGMTEQDYVNFCNLAYDLRRRAEQYFAAHDLEHLRQLQAVARGERGAESTHDFLADLLAEHIEDRERIGSAG